jgi:hypothetical protein
MPFAFQMLLVYLEAKFALWRGKLLWRANGARCEICGQPVEQKDFMPLQVSGGSRWRASVKFIHRDCLFTDGKVAAWAREEARERGYITEGEATSE